MNRTTSWSYAKFLTDRWWKTIGTTSKNSLRVADNPHQIISTKSFPAATESSPEATICSPLEDIAANQSIGQGIVRILKLDHMQKISAGLSEEVTGGNATVEQNDHIRSESTMSN